MKLPKAYNPAEYEADIYALWEKGGGFVPKNRGSDEYFSLAAPPPNANANLHIGYGLTMAIEDAVIRYQRMQGKATLFIPGADHAGFETQVVYEKKLNEEGKSRFDFSREELYRQIWDFVEANKHNFQSQIRALGASCDWNYFTYTLDNKVVAQAYQTFQKMWQEGLIYRGNRIVNFCTFHGTSFSDIEVVHEQEHTKLWHIAYPLLEGGGEVVIATTRPETKLGQSALMVNPKDERYNQLIGKQVKQPLVPDKPIPIIGDEYVDMEFGTGVVTVTPGHDTNDFEVAQRHNLPVIELITTEGKMSDNVPEQFRGMSILDARKAVAKALEDGGYIRKVEDYTHSVGKCYKCGTIIEPLVREQWFVKMRPLADRAIKALQDDKISFYPASKKAQAVRYLTEVKDWNISRQIAWGIPIPAFQDVDNPEGWIFNERVDQETIEVDGKTYKRDPDVFDTWFSSGQWPYITLNYPGDDFKRFYPLSLMETGGEILYQWVARMIMLGLYVTGEIPFKDVYIHGYVLAEDGAKMSKSLGNTVDPFELIGQYGSDALRMGLLTGRRAGVNQGYHPAKIVAGRNFANKLWNVARYIEDKLGDEAGLGQEPQPKSLADHWILSRLAGASQMISKAMESYELSFAYETLYHFVWGDLADWYIEASKVDQNQSVLAYALRQTLKLAHPFAPFVTEAVWQTLSGEQNELLMVQAWPAKADFDPAKVLEFENLKLVVSEIRWLKSMSGLKPERIHYSQDEKLAGQASLIAKLAGLKEVTQMPEGHSGGLRLTSVRSEWRLDIDPAAVLEKLEAKRAEHQKTIESLDKRLANQDYIAKAPEDLVEETKAQKAEESVKLNHLENVLKALKL